MPESAITRVAAPAGTTRAPQARILPVLVAIGAIVLVANRWGQALLDDGVRHRILAPPLIGRLRAGPPAGPLALAVPAAVGASLVVLLPRWASRLRWRDVVLVTAGASVAWAVALAVVDGASGLTRPMELTGHYLQDVGLVDSPAGLWRSFTDEIDRYGTHIRSHPPGFLLVLWSMDQVGLGGSAWAAALVIAGGALAAAAVLAIVREVAGDAVARRAAPFVALAPTAVYVASTADALFAGAGLGAAAVIVRATGGEEARPGLAVAGGVAFGVALLLSYGSALLILLPVAVAVARRRLDVLLLASSGGVAVLVASGVTGFWWFEGLAVTRGEYLESVASVRPYGYFLFANLAALALVLGPATVAGMGRFLTGRRGQLGLAVGPVMAMVLAANLSGMSKGEVERIWLPFAIAALPAASLVVGDDRAAARRWLAVQAVAALAIPTFVRTHW